MDENTNLDTISADAYISELTELKANSVSKQEYERIIAENAKLANALASGIRMEEPEVVEPVNIKELRNKLLTTKYKTDLEYFKDMKTLRDAIIEQEGVDPFVNKSAPDDSTEKSRAERVASLIDYALEQADNDPIKFSAVFNSKIQFPVSKK